MAHAPLSTVSNWLPIATAFTGFVIAIMGILSAQMLELFKDRRAHRHEEEARDAERRDAQLERRNEFQRQALLQLQDPVMNLMRTVGSCHLFDMKRWTEERVWHVEPFPEELNTANGMRTLRPRCWESAFMTKAFEAC